MRATHADADADAAAARKRGRRNRKGQKRNARLEGGAQVNLRIVIEFRWCFRHDALPFRRQRHSRAQSEFPLPAAARRRVVPVNQVAVQNIGSLGS